MHSRAPLPPRSVLFDAVIALGIGLLDWTVALPLSSRLSPGVRVVALALVTVHAASIAGRRLWPWPAFALGIVTGLLALAAGLPMVALTIGPVVLLYSVASRTPGRTSAAALALSSAAFFAAEAITGFQDDASTIVADLLVLGAAWLIGWFVYRRQEYVEQLERKTEELQQAREELARVAVAEERLRIARELHDIVAHSLSIISVQSGVGAHVIDSRPDEARAALANVERVSRQTLNEMRALLGMLRDQDAHPDRAPLPGLSQLPALIEQVTSSGPNVELRISGAEKPLPPGIDLTAYRVIQESLTNVLRHAGARLARVSLTYEPSSLIIEVVDDGLGASGASNGGLGIVGMRERLQAFGGSLETGPLKESGFRVRAEVPLPEMSS